MISKIDKTKLDLCDGVFWNNRYLLAVPFVLDEPNGLGLESEFGVLLESGSLLELEAAFPRNNAVIIYHSLARSWLGYWDNWQVSDFFATSFSTFGPVLMFAGDMTSISAGAGQVWSFNDFLAVSDVLDPLHYAKVTNDFKLNTGTNDRVVAISAFNNTTLVIFKQRSVLAVENLYGDLSAVRLTEVTREFNAAREAGNPMTSTQLTTRANELVDERMVSYRATLQLKFRDYLESVMSTNPGANLPNFTPGNELNELDAWYRGLTDPTPTQESVYSALRGQIRNHYSSMGIQ